MALEHRSFNVLEVRPRQYERGWDDPIWVADLWVNGRSLLDLACALEMDFARRERRRYLAGSYAPIGIDDVYLPSRHLPGHPIPFGRSDDRTALFSCTCTVFGCWPLLATVQITDDGAVIWRDFGNPWLGPEWREDDRQWRYDGLGPFVFRLEQYEMALRRPEGLKGLGRSIW